MLENPFIVGHFGAFVCLAVAVVVVLKKTRI